MGTTLGLVVTHDCGQPDGLPGTPAQKNAQPICSHMNIEDYERTGQAAYASFARTVATILAAAIEREGGYRLQQVTTRAKSQDSLRKKLQIRGLVGTSFIESNIKDLAGCRLVFYTNSDVTRFISSSIVYQNFEIREVKLHHPQKDAEEASELYISNHYLVALRPERVALPEYASFADMRCEIQVQTILNHAWAEMAHDTIYKAPELGSFGATQFDGIKKRLHKVARKYLVPAGYEFQQIAHDFQRLIHGKALFDGDALEAIVQASDNNLRAQAIETFSENVLPFYDDLPNVYQHLVDRLIVGADAARSASPAGIATPYGELPGKTFADIISAIAEILTRYRYVELRTTFRALRILYGWTNDEAAKRPLIDLGKALAKHHLEVWRSYGPVAQVTLLEFINELGDDERRSLAPLVIPMLREMLDIEVTGTTSTSSALTIHRGTVPASEALRDLRKKAIFQLQHQFTISSNEAERQEVLLALQTATRPAMGPGYTNELARLVMDDTCSIILFQKKIAATLNLSLRQSAEARVYRNYQMYAALPDGMREDVNLIVAQSMIRVAAITFRDTVNADQDFVHFKTLVGFDYVYPGAWENNTFDYAATKAYREKEMNALLATVDAESCDTWFDRINRYTQIESNDAATFPVLWDFIAKLAATQPMIALGYVERLTGPLRGFLPAMLTGLFASTHRRRIQAKVDGWLRDGLYLEQITWYLRTADPFDEDLLQRSMESAIQYGNAEAIRNAVLASADQYANHPGTLITTVFLPALGHLATLKDFSWIQMPWVSWLGCPIIESLDRDQAEVVLRTLLTYPHLEDAPEYIAASIAKNWPESAIEFLGQRQAFKRGTEAPANYDALPFSVYELQEPLAAVPHLMLAAARQWFDADPLLFPYDGGKFLASVFPNLANSLDECLVRIISDGDEGDFVFVLAVLSAFEGKKSVYELVRRIVAALDANSSLLQRAIDVLQQSGVVTGEFGFAELSAERKELLTSWLSDESNAVRTFAESVIQRFDQQIAAETRSAEASIALRRLQYDEDLGT